MSACKYSLVSLGYIHVTILYPDNLFTYNLHIKFAVTGFWGEVIKKTLLTPAGKDTNRLKKRLHPSPECWTSDSTGVAYSSVRSSKTTLSLRSPKVFCSFQNNCSASLWGWPWHAWKKELHWVTHCYLNLHRYRKLVFLDSYTGLVGFQDRGWQVLEFRVCWVFRLVDWWAWVGFRTQKRAQTFYLPTGICCHFI